MDRNHLELLKNFPAHFRFVVLQHSPDRSVITRLVLFRMCLLHFVKKLGGFTYGYVPSELATKCVYSDPPHLGLVSMPATSSHPNLHPLLPRRDNLHHKLVGNSCI